MTWVNNSAGYAVNNPQDDTYGFWSNTMGEFRWRHEDGTPRTYSAVDGKWVEIFDKVTRQTDIHYFHRHLTDIVSFTDEFISRVPFAWEKFRATMELLLGSLEGERLNPYNFNDLITSKRSLLSVSNFNRDTSGNSASVTNRNLDNTSHSTHNEDVTTESGTDSESKNRSVASNFPQGTISGKVPDIGETNYDYATTMQDANALTDTTTKTVGTERDINDSVANQKGRDDYSSNETENLRGNSDTNDTELIERTAGNFYHNLTFLTSRIDRLEGLLDFWQYFSDLFSKVEVYRKEY